MCWQKNVNKRLHLTHLPPSAAYMRQWTWSSLVQVMACRLSGAKPLPGPMLPYCQLNPEEQILVKFKSDILIQEYAFEYVVMVLATICLGIN